MEVDIIEHARKFYPDPPLNLMPICLPQSPYEKDEDTDVWIDGYNFFFHRKVPVSKKYFDIERISYDFV